MSHKTRRIIGNSIVCSAALVVCVIAVELVYRATVEKKHYVYSKGLFIPDKDFGYKLSPSTRGYARKNEYNNEIITNELGFRDIEHTREKQNGTTRILVIGDSFTMGYTVQAEEMYTRVLHTLLNAKKRKKFEVINAGVAGYDTPQETAYLQRDGIQLKPDAVLLAWYYNDVMGQPVGEGPYVVDGYLVTPPSNPRALSTRLFSTLRSWKFVWSVIEGKLTAAGTKTEAVNPANFDIDSVRIARVSNATDEKIKTTLAHLGSFIAVAKKNKIPVLVMLIPADFHVVPAKRIALLSQYGVKGSDVEFSTLYNEIADFLRSQKVLTLNLYPLLAAQKNVEELYFNEDGHFTAKGNAFIAGIISDTVTKLLNK